MDGRGGNACSSIVSRRSGQSEGEGYAGETSRTYPRNISAIRLCAARFLFTSTRDSNLSTSYYTQGYAYAPSIRVHRDHFPLSLPRPGPSSPTRTSSLDPPGCCPRIALSVKFLPPTITLDACSLHIVTHALVVWM